MGEFVATIDPDGDAIVYNETFSGYLSPEPSAYWWDYLCANLVLLEPGLKPRSRVGWDHLPLLLTKLRAIGQGFIHSDTRILIRKVTPRDGACCKPSKPAAGMTFMMSSVATSMPSAVPSSARKHRCRAEDYDYADD